jgi:glycerol-3-phosphate dehydrogenase subunit B
MVTHSIDLLETAAETPLEDAIAAFIPAHPLHPYALVGWDNIASSLEAFAALFADNLDFASRQGKNSLLPTGAGTFRSSFLVSAACRGGVGLIPEQTIIVGIEGLKDFYPEYVAYHLQCRGITIAPPAAAHRVTTAAGFAALLDDPDFLTSFALLVNKRLAGEKYLGLPAILGLHQPGQALAVMKEITGCQVFEIPMLPPSLPGMRIFNLFKEHLRRQGVTILQGHRVTAACLEGKRCRSITLENPPLKTSYEAQEFILATGRFLGGGLISDQNRLWEPLFNLPVCQPPARRDWFQRHFFSPLPHPIHEAGIRTDQSLRPIDDQGGVMLENVRVAGSLLAHHNPSLELSREGLALATGYWAGCG